MCLLSLSLFVYMHMCMIMKINFHLKIAGTLPTTWNGPLILIVVRRVPAWAWTCAQWPFGVCVRFAGSRTGLAGYRN